MSVTARFEGLFAGGSIVYPALARRCEMCAARRVRVVPFRTSTTTPVILGRPVILGAGEEPDELGGVEERLRAPIGERVARMRSQAATATTAIASTEPATIRVRGERRCRK